MSWYGLPASKLMVRQYDDLMVFVLFLIFCLNGVVAEGLYLSSGSDHRSIWVRTTVRFT